MTIENISGYVGSELIGHFKDEAGYSKSYAIFDFELQFFVFDNNYFLEIFGAGQEGNAIKLRKKEDLDDIIQKYKDDRHPHTKENKMFLRCYNYIRKIYEEQHIGDIEHNIIVKMPPKKRSTMKVRVRQIKKGEPRPVVPFEI